MQSSNLYAKKYFDKTDMDRLTLNSRSCTIVSKEQALLRGGEVGAAAVCSEITVSADLVMVAFTQVSSANRSPGHCTITPLLIVKV